MIMSLLIVTISKLLLMMVKSSRSLKYFFGGENENFVNASNFLSLNKDNKEFIFFVLWHGTKHMTNNYSIHVESKDTF